MGATSFLKCFFFFSFVVVVYMCPFSLQVCLASLERLQFFESLRERQNNKKRAEATEAPLSIRLPDGRTVKGTAGVTTPLFVAQSVR